MHNWTKKYIAIVVSTLLTGASLIGLPLKHYSQKIHEDPKCIKIGPKIWTPAAAKIYAISFMKWQFPEWGKGEHRALLKLWGKESGWNHLADNPDSSAYGIAQVLNTKHGTPAPLQIERGLEYIVHRYEKPSVAWSHWRKYKWY